MGLTEQRIIGKKVQKIIKTPNIYKEQKNWVNNKEQRIIKCKIIKHREEWTKNTETEKNDKVENN